MDRLEQVRQAMQVLLDSGQVEGVLALRATGLSSVPRLFRSGEDLSGLILWPKYPTPKTMDLLLRTADGVRLGMVVRGCEERGLIELAKHNQVDLERLSLIGLACTAEERNECRCAWPFPSRIDAGQKVEGVADALVAELEALSPEARTEFWRKQFDSCIKCYACRTACPQCFCETCILEDNLWVEQGALAPPFPSYHLIRAYHTVAKCVGCMECEAACPADIPLAALYAMLRRDGERLFGYIPGRSVDDPPPLVIETLWDGHSEVR